ncbi:MAG TPA: hypothetical protein VGG27_00955 [Magnetospirillaceae bacterium]|jgi:hypothetical protein
MNALASLPASLLAGRRGHCGGQTGSLGQRGNTFDHHHIGFRHGVGHFRLVQPRCYLLLPEVEVAARELIKIGRIGHSATIMAQLRGRKNNSLQSGRRLQKIW